MTYTEYKVRAVSVVILCCVGNEDKKSLHMFSTDAHFKKRFFCPLLVKGDCEHGGLTACVEPWLLLTGKWFLDLFPLNSTFQMDGVHTHTLQTTSSMSIICSTQQTRQEQRAKIWVGENAPALCSLFSGSYLLSFTLASFFCPSTL